MCVRAYVRICMLEVMRKMLNEVFKCIYVISRVPCTLLQVVYLIILLTLLFSYCALRAHVCLKCLTNTPLHDIVVVVTSQDAEF